MVYLTLDDVLAIRDALAATRAAHGDGDRYGVRTLSGLLSALAAPRRSAFGAELFPTLSAKAGALAFSLVQNHPFWDGNKRIAAAALRQFVEHNAARLDADDHALKLFTGGIARGQIRDEALAEWAALHIVGAP
ncbi:MAG TPA: type II toxin-antitoxin system death-on-curing family toxin [Kouleothrix sp.]|uniref:type II toxin-antitoxin system death-on-curing family toxin n=1 Tax=Kouleothrix sp. TaxID=2779161 RepID=UPI002C9015EE|nr:type II toxin-antitoxin system death-on-curing family toxin [Kouleothrix sp.]HRC75096.1 type II toxin-antitoxin system death-on-curing family toxin [Kouleothrix sp.]